MIATEATLAMMHMAEATAARIEAAPGTRFAWLPNQWAFLNDPGRFRLIRQGNQFGGKTIALLYDLVCHLLGEHPFLDVPPPPVRWWLVCAETGQSLEVMQKLWDMCPKHLLHPGCEFDEVIGFRGRRPALRFNNGSIAIIKTEAQKGKSLATGTLDGVAIDEPPGSMRKYTELRKRVMMTGGKLTVAMTPANAGNLDWLANICAAGQLNDHHIRMVPEALIPVGHDRPIELDDGTPCDAAWIDREIESTPEYEREVTCHGGWEYRSVGKMFGLWDPVSMVTSTAPEGMSDLHLGIDYGTGTGKQYACLVAVQPGDTPLHDLVHVLDETPTVEDSTIGEDAQHIIDMLNRNDMEWADLDERWGDRAYVKSDQQKSNKELLRAIRRRLKKRSAKGIRMIRTVKRGEGRGPGSVSQGIRYLHRVQVARRFTVAPRCVRMREALDRWDGSQRQSRHTTVGVYRDSYWKDPIDALRYALESRIFYRRPVSSTRVVLG